MPTADGVVDCRKSALEARLAGDGGSYKSNQRSVRGRDIDQRGEARNLDRFLEEEIFYGLGPVHIQERRTQGMVLALSDCSPCGRCGRP